MSAQGHTIEAVTEQGLASGTPDSSAGALSIFPNVSVKDIFSTLYLLNKVLCFLMLSYKLGSQMFYKKHKLVYSMYPLIDSIGLFGGSTQWRKNTVK